MKKPVVYKKDQILYSLSIDDDGKCLIDKYRVSTVNKNGVYAILIAPWTWINKAAKGKTFSKTKDFGWASDIPSWCRKYTSPGRNFYDLYTTEKQAWRSMLGEDKMRYWEPDAIDRAQKRIKRALK